MRVLLDTNVLLWWLADSPELGPRARALISAPEHTVFVSVVTLWEVWLKVSLGKLSVPEDFEQRLAAEVFESLPLLPHHTRRVALLPWHHRDPLDRMLVAQAQADGLTFLTADARMSPYGDFVLVLD